MSTLPGASNAPLVSLIGVGKVFPNVVANAEINLDIRGGEIHALLGENGAGKSTLMNILTGQYRPDSGQMLVDGREVSFGSPLQAIEAGIGMVHQHFRLVKAFTVAENVMLGHPGLPFRMSATALEAMTAALARRFHLDIRPKARVDELSAGEQQRVEILRVLSRNARVLILDEPTAVLSPGEVRALFSALRACRYAGNAVVLIGHKLDEVLAIADQITVLRGGRKVATQDARGATAGGLARQMIGRDLAGLNSAKSSSVACKGTPVAVLEAACVSTERGVAVLTDVDLQILGGEIVGIAGVAGNGQRELSEVLAGMRPLSRGRMSLCGRPVIHADPRAFAVAGVGHVPEDRLRTALAPTLSIVDNMALRDYRLAPMAYGPWLRRTAMRAFASNLACVAAVDSPNLTMPIRNLSGGNQQRLVVRRELGIATTMLIAVYPCRGLDVGASQAVMQSLTDLRERGVAVVLVSDDLDELTQVSDRIAVLSGGRVQGVLPTAEATPERIGLLMGGGRSQPPHSLKGDT